MDIVRSNNDGGIMTSDLRDIDISMIEDISKNPYTESIPGLEIEDTPFAAKRAEIQKSNMEGVAPPRCRTCGELIPNLNPGQVVMYCNRVCRLTRNKRGQKRLLQLMKNSGAKFK